jgi:Na+/proline symporter
MLMLAGVFAASMSTADSLILSRAANLSEDSVPRERLPMIFVKSATIIAMVLTLSIALFGDQNVFSLVIGAWAVMAAAFAPILTVYALGGRVSGSTALAMLLSGVASVNVSKAFPMLADYYEGMLGVIVGFAVYGIGRALGLATTAAHDEPERAPQRTLPNRD